MNITPQLLTRKSSSVKRPWTCNPIRFGILVTFCTILLLQSGCGTYQNLRKNKIPFGGVGAHVELWVEGSRDLINSNAGPEATSAAIVIATFSFFDLPFTVVGDIVTLPYTVPYTLATIDFGEEELTTPYQISVVVYHIRSDKNRDKEERRRNIISILKSLASKYHLKQTSRNQIFRDSKRDISIELKNTGESGVYTLKLIAGDYLEKSQVTRKLEQAIEKKYRKKFGDDFSVQKKIIRGK